MSKKIAVIAVLAMAAAGAVFALGKRAKHTGEIRLTGTIEATTTELSFKTAGRIAARTVDEGQLVKAGQEIARLEDNEIRQELAGREADAGAAQAALQELQAGSRSEEIAQAEAAVGRFTAEAQRAADEYRRVSQLFKREVVPRRDLDQAVAVRDASAAGLREASERLRLVRAGARIETRRQAAARLKGSEAALGLARIRLEQSVLTSPVSGVILATHVEPGEHVAPGTPVVSVAQLDKVWLRGYVAESDLPRIRLGQKARITLDGLPGNGLEGTLSFIAQEAEFTPKNVQTEKERVKLVYRVKITLDNPQGVLKPGMPADAVVVTSP